MDADEARQRAEDKALSRVNTEYGSLPISDLATQDLIDGIRDALSELHREPVWECHGCDAQNLLDELARRLAALHPDGAKHGYCPACDNGLQCPDGAA